MITDLLENISCSGLFLDSSASGLTGLYAVLSNSFQKQTYVFLRAWFGKIIRRVESCALTLVDIYQRV